MTFAEPAVAHTEFDPLPMKLPGDGAQAADGGQPDAWLLGIRSKDEARRIVERFNGAIIGDSAARVTTPRARAAAAALKRAGALVYAEPDVVLESQSAYESLPFEWARGAVLPDTLIPPLPGRMKVGIIDHSVDMTHSDVAGQTTPIGGAQVPTDPHGTEVASAISGVFGNGGVIGVWPGVPILSWPTDLTCGDIANGVDQLERQGARVINISLGTPSPCVTMNIQIQLAIGTGVLVIAAAGNEFEEGNRPQYPAAFPHVLSVSATTSDDKIAPFSNSNFAVDVAAPGVAVPVAVPLALDADGVQDGIGLADGTSFAAPIAAGVAAWLAAARPALNASQLADALRFGARDAGRRGYDTDFGYGIVDLAGAIDEPAPLRDPQEPNDDIPLIDGTYFDRPDAPIFTGRSRAIGASVDTVEDPADVYRIRMPGHSSVVATARPRFGNADLIAYHDGARTLGSRHAVVDASFRKGADRVALINRGRRAVNSYLAVVPGRSTLVSRYSLRITRTD